MIKRLKTLEQIKEEWECIFGYTIKEDKYKALRFYYKENLKAHITFQMKEYFGKEVDVEKANNKYYEWRLIDSKTTQRIWHFRDDWFVSEFFSLEDYLFEI